MKLGNSAHSCSFLEIDDAVNLLRTENSVTMNHIDLCLTEGFCSVLYHGTFLDKQLLAT